MLSEEALWASRYGPGFVAFRREFAGVMLLDRDNHIRSINREFLDFIGLDDNQFVGIHCMVLFRRLLSGSDLKKVGAWVKKPFQSHCQLLRLEMGPGRHTIVEVSCFKEREGMFLLITPPLASPGEAEPPASVNRCILSGLVEEAAHQILNPLTTIKGFIQLYRQCPGKMPWGLLLEEVEYIEEAVQGFSIISEHYADKVENLNLAEILEEIYPKIEKEAMEKGMWLEMSLSRHPGRVRADRRRLRLLLTRIITCVAAFNPGGGILTLQTTCTRNEVGVQLTNRSLCSVPDSIFRLPGALGYHSAAGLLLCQTIMTCLNGQLLVQENAGSITVSLVFPRSLRNL